MKQPDIKYLIPVLLGAFLLPIPLFRDFHFESAFLAAIIGCLGAGVSGALLKKGSDLKNVFRILGRIYLFGFPLFLYSVISGCLNIHGVGLWLLLPVPSVFFGYSIGRFFRVVKFPAPVFFSIFSILLVGIGGLALDFFTLPQVYFYNHVWGFWPGPIYDEAILITPGLWLFRLLTLLWAVIIWNLPKWNYSILHKSGLALLFLLIIGFYFHLADWGIVTPNRFLKTQLPEHIQTEHFDLWFPDYNITDQEMNYWALKHEFFFEQIVSELEISWPVGRKIESYIYAEAWQKKKLVGAKFTSYVPIWLKQDQLHIAKKHLEYVLEHEMVHVIAKQFGNSLFNGSWSIGLVEGLAEAVAKDASQSSTLHQIIAAEKPYPTANEIETALSLQGFYTNASSISYTMAGSFVQYLLDTYPVDYLKTAYSITDISAAYPVPFDSLVSGWLTYINQIPVDTIDQKSSKRVFSQQSVFQKNCPHSVSKTQALWDELLYYSALNDTTGMYAVINKLYLYSPEFAPVKTEWLKSQLMQGHPDLVLTSISQSDTLLNFLSLKADAYALSDDWAAANQMRDRFFPNTQLRADSLNWTAYLNTTYSNRLPKPDIFSALNISNRYYCLQKALSQHSDTLVTEYSHRLLSDGYQNEYFDIYTTMIDYLITAHEFDLAQQWTDLISVSPLRLRYKERLSQLIDWKNFLSSRGDLQ